MVLCYNLLLSFGHGFLACTKDIILKSAFTFFLIKMFDIDTEYLVLVSTLLDGK